VEEKQTQVATPCTKDTTKIRYMNTEEKLKAIKIVAQLKDEVEANLHELEAIEPHKIRNIACNAGSEIELDDVTSRHMWHLMHGYLSQKRTHLLERAKELMQ
jgi:hypothetical protein